MRKIQRKYTSRLGLEVLVVAHLRPLPDAPGQGWRVRCFVGGCEVFHKTVETSVPLQEVVQEGHNTGFPVFGIFYEEFRPQHHFLYDGDAIVEERVIYQLPFGG